MKKGHQCIYRECKCFLCSLQRRAQMTMKYQQRFWRKQKMSLRLNSFNQGQLCDICRNHNRIELKKNHRCSFSNCNCHRCFLTYQRRETMKKLQRIRRSNVTNVSLSSQSVTHFDNFIDEEMKNEIASSSRLKSIFPFDSKYHFKDTEKYEENENADDHLMPSLIPLRRISPPPLIPLEHVMNSSDSLKNIEEYSRYSNTLALRDSNEINLCNETGPSSPPLCNIQRSNPFPSQTFLPFTTNLPSSILFLSYLTGYVPNCLTNNRKFGLELVQHIPIRDEVLKFSSSY